MNSERFDPLRLNVGFLLHQTVGFSRVFEFEIPSVTVDSDLDVLGLTGELRLTRTAQGLYGQGKIRADVTAECSRCVENFEQPLAADIEELFVYPPERADELVLAIPETGILDLNPLFRETLILAVPLRPVCREDCLGLCPVCGGNRNLSACEHPDQSIDPRFESLKNLLSN